MKISSGAFENNGQVPALYTCDGKDINPPLRFEGAPAGTESLALIVDDPDAPGGTWVHWVLWKIPPATDEIKEGSVPKGALQGRNDFGRKDYGGPCPPSGTHRYYFRLYALDMTPVLGDNATKADLEASMKGHILAHSELIGLYKRGR